MAKRDGQVLSCGQKEALLNHRWYGEGESILLPYLKPIWYWCGDKFVPPYCSPVTLTMMGLCCNMLTSLSLLYCCPTATEEAPPFLYVLCAVGVLFYQLMDALDGHQARKVQDTPLEDAFDHGADSVSLVYLTMATCCALQLGTNPFCMLAFCMAASAVFYVLHWKLYATGVFTYPWPFGETETQLAGSLVFLTSAVMGPSVWSMKVPVFDVQIKVVLVCACLVGGVVTCAQHGWQVFLRQRHHAGKTVQATDVAAPSVILFAILVTAVLVPSLLNTPLFLHQPCVFVLVLGTALAKGNARIMGAYNTFSDAPYVDSCLLIPVLILVISGLNGVSSGPHDGTAQYDSRLLIASLMMSTADLVWYSRALALDMCEGMGISCFTVNPQKHLLFNTVKLQDKNNLRDD